MTAMPKRCLVTGCAGFIGSHLAERLIQLGHTVVGIDNFSDFYPRAVKEDYLAWLKGQPAFTFVEGDLAQMDLAPWLEGVEWAFHQAAQAGVRSSWGNDFAIYTQSNVLATQRLLEAAKGSPTLQAFIYASSSSVYGDAERYPTREDFLPQPISPYGVTKLAGEHLCRLYARAYGVPAVSLRYFTVYGPRQRPDMAFHRFIRAILANAPLIIYGDGMQTRDFTFVGDIVEANLLAAGRGRPGEVYNIGGGSRVTVRQVIALLEEIIGRPARVEFAPAQKGDVLHTAADISKAARELGYQPKYSLREGLAQEVAWLEGRLASQRDQLGRA
jgi:UDP-glucose 4-epimerase